MSDGIRSDCKACGVKAAVEYYKKHPEKKKAKDKKYKQQHLEQIKIQQKEYRNMPKYSQKQRDYIRNWHLKTTYSITTDDYNDMFIEQGGCCAICGTHQSKLKKILRVDHCHETGRVRGLLCDGCNIALSRMKDNINILQNAIKYLGE